MPSTSTTFCAARGLSSCALLLIVGLCSGCEMTVRPTVAPTTDVGDANTSDVADANVVDITDVSVVDITDANVVDIIDVTVTDNSTVDVVTDSAPRTDGPPSDGSSMTYLAALRSIRVAACERAQRCSTATDLTVELCVAGTYRFAFEPAAPRLARQLALLDAGMLSFDPTAIDACLDAIARSCERDSITQDVAAPACSNFLHGRGSTGASCQGTEDCAVGLRCRVDVPGDGGPGCPGVCLAPVEGDFCLDASCGTLQCSLANNYCVRIPFGEVRPRGMPCGARRGTDGIVRYYGCAAGLTCLRGPETTYYCLPLTCTTPCRNDQACEYPSGVCRTYTLLGAGADCSAPQTVCDPGLGLRCDATRRCAPRVSEGGACTGDEVCTRGLVCVAGVCRRRALQPTGGPCFGDEWCESGACAANRCLAPRCW
jgi:hypothetical protein